MNRTVNGSSVIILTSPCMMQKWNGNEKYRSFQYNAAYHYFLRTACQSVAFRNSERHKYNAEQQNK